MTLSVRDDSQCGNTRWRMQRLKYLIREIDQRAGASDLPLLAVSLHFGVRRSTELPRAEQLTNYKVCCPGDVVLNRMRAFQGALGLADEAGLVSPDYAVLRPAGNLSGRFLTYLLRSRWGIAQMASRIRGIGGTAAGNVRTPRVNVDDISDVRAAVPDRPEQEMIADFLDRECARIGLVLVEIEAQRSVIDEALAASFRSMSFGKPEAALRRFVLSVSDGPFGSSLASEHYVEDEETRVIRLGNVGSARFEDHDRAFVADAYANTVLSEHLVEAGDVIIAGLGDANQALGRACVVPAEVLPAVHKADCYRVRVDHGKCLPQYLALALSYGPARQAAELLSRGATRARLNTSVARDLPVPLVSLDVQRNVVHACDAAMSRASTAEQELSDLAIGLRAYRDALITEAVTGELDVMRLTETRMAESIEVVRLRERPEALAT